MHIVVNPDGRFHARHASLVPIAEHKGYRCLPEVLPDYDPAIQYRLPPEEPIPPDATEYRHRVIDKTAEQIAAETAAERRRERDAAMPEALNVLDRHRNQRDYGLPCALTDEQAAAWAVYLQALRDYPETGDWPVRPTEE